MTTIYNEYYRNLKPTYSEDGVEIAPAIDLNDVAFSAALMSFEYIPNSDDEDVDQTHIVASFPAFLTNNAIQIYSMSEIIEKANEKLAELSDDDQKRAAGFLVYCDAGLCFYEPLELQNNGR